MADNNNILNEAETASENEKILMDCILKCIIPGQNIIVKIENIKSIW